MPRYLWLILPAFWLGTADARAQTISVPDSSSRPQLRQLDILSATDNKRALAASPDKRLVAVGENGRTFRIVDVSTMTTMRQLVGHGYTGYQWAAFSPDGRYLYTVILDGMIPTNLGQDDTSADATDLDASPENVGRYFQQAMKGVAGDRFVAKWDLSTGEMVDKFLANPQHKTTGIAVSPARNELAFAMVRSGGAFIRYINLSTGKSRRADKRLSLDEVFSPISLIYAPNGRHLVASTAQATIVLSLDSGQARKIDDYDWAMYSPGLTFVGDQLFVGRVESSEYEVTIEQLLHDVRAARDAGREGDALAAMFDDDNSLAGYAQLLARGGRNRKIQHPTKQVHNAIVYIYDVNSTRRVQKLSFGQTVGDRFGTGIESYQDIWSQQPVSVYDLNQKGEFVISIAEGTSWKSDKVTKDLDGSYKRSRLPVKQRLDLVLSDKRAFSGLVSWDLDQQKHRILAVDAQPLFASGITASSSGTPLRLIAASPDGLWVVEQQSEEFLIRHTQSRNIVHRVQRTFHFGPNLRPEQQLDAMHPTLAEFDRRATKFVLAEPIYTQLDFADLRRLLPDDFYSKSTEESRLRAGMFVNPPLWRLTVVDLASGVAKPIDGEIRGSALDISWSASGDSLFAAAANDAAHHIILMVADIEKQETRSFILDQTKKPRNAHVGYDRRAMVALMASNPESQRKLERLGSSALPSLIVNSINNDQCEVLFQPYVQFDGRQMRLTNPSDASVRRIVFDRRSQKIPRRVKFVEPRTETKMNYRELLQSLSPTLVPVCIGMSGKAGYVLVMERVKWDPTLSMPFLGRPGSTTILRQESGMNPRAAIYDLESGRFLRNISVSAASFQRLENRIHSRLGDLPKYDLPEHLFVRDVQTSPSGKYIAISFHDPDKTSIILNANSGETMAEFIGARSVFFMEDDDEVLVGRAVWNLGTKEKVRNILESDGVDEPPIVATVKGQRNGEADRTDKKLGWLWFTGMGVNDYEDVRYQDLGYCEADVSAISESLREKLSGVHSRFEGRPLLGRIATAARIEEALRDLSKGVQSDDCVVIMFAGHGVQGQRGLYFATAESRHDALQGTAVNWETMAQLIAGIDAHRIIVLLDACHSGAFAESNLRIQQSLQERFRNKDGVVVIASSKGDGLSFELANLGHGAFTVAVLEALDGKADRDQDNSLRVREFFEYVSERVDELTGGRQTPIMPVQQLDDDDVLFTARAVDVENEIEFTASMSLVRPLRNPAKGIQQQTGSLSDQFVNSLGMTIKLIRPGQFLMGSFEEPSDVVDVFPFDDPSWHQNQTPQHPVKISRPFYLAANEVTNEQFRRFVEATGYVTDRERSTASADNPTGAADADKSVSWRETGLKQRLADHPVTCVTWYDAQAFCRWLGDEEGRAIRLPTQAEWEYACRAGTETRYWNGNDPEQLAQVANIPNRRRGTPLSIRMRGGEGLFWGTYFFGASVKRVTISSGEKGLDVATDDSPSVVIDPIKVRNESKYNLTIKHAGHEQQLERGAEFELARVTELSVNLGFFMTGRDGVHQGQRHYGRLGAMLAARFENNQWRFDDKLDYLDLNLAANNKLRIVNRSRNLLHIFDALHGVVRISPGETKTVTVYDAKKSFNIEADDGFSDLAPVGQFPANPFGIHDMHGNVWEWCDDPHYPYVDSDTPVVDHVGKQSDTYVIRGGCFL